MPRGASIAVVYIATFAQTAFAQEITTPTCEGNTCESATPVSSATATGFLTGVIRNVKNTAPLMNATIQSNDGMFSTQSDSEGRFLLSLPPGHHKITASAAGFTTQRDIDIEIEADRAYHHNLQLTPQKTPEPKHEQKKQSQQPQHRSHDPLAMISTWVWDPFVANSMLTKRHLYPYELPPRYASFNVNGFSTPGLGAIASSISLDLLPIAAFEIDTGSRYPQANLRGASAGGTTNLQTRTMPAQPYTEWYASIGVNSATTRQMGAWPDRFQLQDALAIGHRKRDLPKDFPSSTIADLAATPNTLATLGQSLYHQTKVLHNAKMPPHFKVGALTGEHKKLPNGGEINAILSANYQRGYQTLREKIKIFAEQDLLQNKDPVVDYHSLRSNIHTQWNLLGHVDWTQSAKHRYSFSSILLRDADNEARELSGFAHNIIPAQPLLSTRIRYRSQLLTWNRLHGTHTLQQTKKLSLSWDAGYAFTNQSTPALREMLFRKLEQNYQLETGPYSNRQLYTDQRDHHERIGVRFNYPFTQWAALPAELSWGIQTFQTQRQFDTRHFRYATVPELAANIPEGTGNLFSQETIGDGLPAIAGGTQPFYLQEITNSHDNYRGFTQNYASFASLKLPLTDWVSTEIGLRYEYNRIIQFPYDRFSNITDLNFHTHLYEHDLLPSFLLTFHAPANINIQLKVAKFIDRPALQELSPFAFTNFLGGFTEQGNPYLQSSDIWSSDIRLEWLPSLNEVIALSGFLHYINAPIESVVTTVPQNLRSFTNTDYAFNTGAKLKLRKHFAFIHEVLRKLSVGMHAAYTYSYAQSSPVICHDSTNQACQFNAYFSPSAPHIHPLQGQSTVRVNTYLDYDNQNIGTYARLSFQTYTPKLIAVGGNTLLDMYQDTFHSLDLSFEQRVQKKIHIGVSASNMLNWPLRFFQGKKSTDIYLTKPGATINFSLSYKI